MELTTPGYPVAEFVVVNEELGMTLFGWPFAEGFATS
jgi:hypothetical protein